MFPRWWGSVWCHHSVLRCSFPEVYEALDHARNLSQKMDKCSLFGSRIFYLTFAFWFVTYFLNKLDDCIWRMHLDAAFTILNCLYIFVMYLISSNVILLVARATADWETSEASGPSADRGAGTGTRLFTYMSSYVSSLIPEKIKFRLIGIKASVLSGHVVRLSLSSEWAVDCGIETSCI